MATTFPFLIELVEESTAGLPDVSRRRMFGCDGYFAGDQIFALLWKTGRIGVKLPDPDAHAELLALPGAEPWTIGAKTMSTWALVPEDWHDEPAALQPWLRRAYAQANQPVAPKATKKTAARTTSAKDPGTRKASAKEPTASKKSSAARR